MIEALKRFQADVAPYFRQYPFMARDPEGELDGNCILYAGTFALIYHRLFGMYADASAHAGFLYVQSYLPEQPGLITRGPHKWNDPQTHDDYMGLATMSGLGNSGPAKAIALHGKTHGWSFRRRGHDNIREIFNAQFWRLPGLVGHLKLCAGEAWSVLDTLWWALGVYGQSITPKSGTSGIILKWHMVRMYEARGKRNWLCDGAVRNWKHKIIALYPNAMGDVFRIYYGPDHPFAKWANGII